VEDQFANSRGMQAEVTGLVEDVEEGSSSGESSDHPSIDQTEYCEILWASEDHRYRSFH